MQHGGAGAAVEKGSGSTGARRGVFCKQQTSCMPQTCARRKAGGEQAGAGGGGITGATNLWNKPGRAVSTERSLGSQRACGRRRDELRGRLT
jgi:hypothetical protein